MFKHGQAALKCGRGGPGWTLRTGLVRNEQIVCYENSRGEWGRATANILPDKKRLTI